jgi:hypothetical protein
MARESRREGSRERREHERRPDRDGDGPEEYEHEPYDDPAEHLAIERRRFAGGLPPTPELYALAREQWYRLPGVLVRPSMDTNAGDTSAGDTDAGDREPER